MENVAFGLGGLSSAMVSQMRQPWCALLAAVLLAPLVVARTYDGSHHYALSVQQAKVCPLASCIFAFHLWSLLL